MFPGETWFFSFPNAYLHEVLYLIVFFRGNHRDKRSQLPAFRPYISLPHPTPHEKTEPLIRILGQGGLKDQWNHSTHSVKKCPVCHLIRDVRGLGCGVPHLVGAESQGAPKQVKCILSTRRSPASYKVPLGLLRITRLLTKLIEHLLKVLFDTSYLHRELCLIRL